MADTPDTPARQTWEERQKVIDEAVAAKMGPLTPEAFLQAAQDTSLSDELNELAWWYTDEFDKQVIDLYESNAGLCDRYFESKARQTVAASNPEKFKRLRELEAIADRQNRAHQRLASSSHASITEQNLRMKGLDR